MYKPVEPQPNFPRLEEEVLEYWKKNKIFEKSSQKNSGNPSFVFFEGPPTANGRPGLHHMESRAFKDVILRFQTMLGKFIIRKAGWDTQGLPVEIEVEKQLKISGKRDIENLVPGDKTASIEKFNRLCRDSVWKYKDEWEKFTSRMGFWLDMSAPYITYESRYIESVWWILKSLWNKKVQGQPLVYQGHKVLPYCPRCGTALSSHEVAQGYENIEENSVYLQFLVLDKSIEIKNEQGQPVVIMLDKPTYVLSWTTTPWTLPGNVALAVGEKITYALVTNGRENYLLAESLLTQVIKEKTTVLEKIPGKFLVGLSYEPLFKIPELQSPQSYKVYAADFVNTQEGTGVVHTAVMYGEDDYELGTAVGLPKRHTVNEEGKFFDIVPGLGGRSVKDPETEKIILKHLKHGGTLFATRPYRHDYPFCWRCKTPLLYYARDSWFIRMSALRAQLLANNRQINWVPAYIKDGRFGEWLAEAKDWAISRDRYWGTPLPIWKCAQCGEFECIGSIAELKEKALKFQFPNSNFQTNPKFPSSNSKANKQQATSNKLEDFDLHRPYIDQVKLKCEKCGNGEMARVPEVVDAWLDSGTMPYSQWHYPFENKEKIECAAKAAKDHSAPPAQAGLALDGKPAVCQFPADYISEAIDQTRGWFYTLLAISTALGEKRPPYKNVICLGHVLDGKGQKMSKSRGNIVEPMGLMARRGTDIVRWYLFSVNQAGDSKSFSEEDLIKMQRRVQLIFWNVYNYFVTYANANQWQFDPQSSPALTKSSSNPLDQWINARLQAVENLVTENLESYNIFRAVRGLEEYLSDLSTWYLRRSRGRSDPEFFATLFRNLIYSVKLMAPFMPFFTEKIYQNLNAPGFAESVHLDVWPAKNELTEAQKNLLARMAQVRQMAESVLAWRKANNLKVRQPLSHLVINSADPGFSDFAFLLADELNIINVEISPRAPTSSEYVKIAAAGKHPDLFINPVITPELRVQGLARDMERLVQELRKASGLQVGQKVDLFYETSSQEIYGSFEYFDQEKTSVGKVIGARQPSDFEKELEIGGQKIWIGLKRTEE